MTADAFDIGFNPCKNEIEFKSHARTQTHAERRRDLHRHIHTHPFIRQFKFPLKSE